MARELHGRGEVVGDAVAVQRLAVEVQQVVTVVHVGPGHRQRGGERLPELVGVRARAAAGQHGHRGAVHAHGVLSYMKLIVVALDHG